MTPLRRYAGALCADHGPVEVDQHGRCTLCGQDTHARGLVRQIVQDRAHDAALEEDAARDVIAAELVPVPAMGRLYRPEFRPGPRRSA
jgi:hypothetical protein